MARTVAFYSFNGVSKAKTERAILFRETSTNRQAWLPLSVTSVKFVGGDYKVTVSVPDWFFNKIKWSTITD